MSFIQQFKAEWKSENIIALKMIIHMIIIMFLVSYNFTLFTDTVNHRPFSLSWHQCLFQSQENDFVKGHSVCHPNFFYMIKNVYLLNRRRHFQWEFITIQKFEENSSKFKDKIRTLRSSGEVNFFFFGSLLYLLNNHMWRGTKHLSFI